jgi:hypothetical protein
VVSVSLNPHEFGEVELPCDDTVTSLTLHASGKVVADVQASNCGRTWPSPCASARLDTEERTLLLNLPQGTRKIRVLLHNHSAKSALVQIDELAGAVPEVQGETKVSR